MHMHGFLVVILKMILFFMFVQFNLLQYILTSNNSVRQKKKTETKFYNLKLTWDISVSVSSFPGIGPKICRVVARLGQYTTLSPF